MTQQPGRLYSGGITFCGMQPMRNIPFAVIGVLGMQDAAFPRRQRDEEFDLMHTDRRAGDPHRGDEDRYLMLETLLCARRHLYFSYCGRSLRDNAECQPSVLLRELLDYLDSHLVTDDGAPASEHITRYHPMQPFSARNFAADCAGYDKYWFNAAQDLDREIEQVTPGWQRESLPSITQPATELDLTSLKRFFQHPPRFFFQQRLGLSIPRDDELSDDEVFALDTLQRWALGEDLGQRYVSGEDVSPATYLARGLLPHGTAAHIEWANLSRHYAPLMHRLDRFRGQSPQARAVEVHLDDGDRVAGEVTRVYPGLGPMHFSASKTISGRTLMPLWLDHLALCAAGQLASGEHSQLLLLDSSIRFRPVEREEAQRLLVTCVAQYREGQHYPLPLFPRTSLAWVQADSDTAARKAADETWRGSQSGVAGEQEDVYLRLALNHGDSAPIDDPEFQRCARDVYGPPLAAGETDADS